MVGLTVLWLPVLLSAVAVFVASSIAHMVLTYHRSDFQKLPEEDAALEALHDAGVGPGNYMFPHCASMKELGTPEIRKKMQRGPVGMLFLTPPGPPAMGRQLALWFVYLIGVGVMVAYVSGRTLEPGTPYLQVFRVAATVAFLAYAGAQPIFAIWKAQKWNTTLKDMLDGLVYAWLTGGVFGWLWPGA